MTLGFFGLTVGAILIVQGFSNRSLADLVLGRPGPGQPADIVSGSTDSGGVAGTSGGPIEAAPSGAKGKHPVGVVNYNGKPVAAWIAAYFPRLRQSGWDGCITSGYRDPKYSEQLCYDKCGAPSCPGVCAGKTSNHSGRIFPAGAIDVCSPSSFQAALDKHPEVPLKNDLPSDLVHFSFSGH